MTTFLWLMSNTYVDDKYLDMNQSTSKVLSHMATNVLSKVQHHKCLVILWDELIDI